METVLFVDRRTKSLMQLKDSAIIHVEIGIDDIRVVRGEPRPIYVRDFVPLARNDQAEASAPPPVTVSENPIQREVRLFAILHQEGDAYWAAVASPLSRSEEHTSELQSLMRISYAVFCLKKKTKTNTL